MAVSPCAEYDETPEITKLISSESDSFQSSEETLEVKPPDDFLDIPRPTKLRLKSNLNERQLKLAFGGSISLNSIFKGIDKAVERAKNRAEDQIQKQLGLQNMQNLKKYTAEEVNKGVDFLVNYLGSTQLQGSKKANSQEERQKLAKEAADRVRQSEMNYVGNYKQPSTGEDVF